MGRDNNNGSVGIMFNKMGLLTELSHCFEVFSGRCQKDNSQRFICGGGGGLEHLAFQKGLVICGFHKKNAMLCWLAARNSMYTVHVAK